LYQLTRNGLPKFQLPSNVPPGEETAAIRCFAAGVDKFHYCADIAAQTERNGVVETRWNGLLDSGLRTAYSFFIRYWGNNSGSRETWSRYPISRLNNLLLLIKCFADMNPSLTG
jgi:hypothetical protein